MLHLALVLALQAPAGQAPPDPAPPADLREVPASLELGPENYAAWGAFIRPSAEERKFESIGWRNTFWPAVEEARALGRPLLLWTMNGHPLGTT